MVMEQGGGGRENQPEVNHAELVHKSVHAAAAAQHHKTWLSGVRWSPG